MSSFVLREIKDRSGKNVQLIGSKDMHLKERIDTHWSNVWLYIDNFTSPLSNTNISYYTSKHSTRTRKGHSILQYASTSECSVPAHHTQRVKNLENEKQSTSQRNGYSHLLQANGDY